MPSDQFPPNKKMVDVVKAVREAGVVGAGGAGFPAHVKLDTKADTVVANGAECEPLLHKDAELTEAFTASVLRGIELSMQATGAKNAVFGIKAKRKAAVAALEKASRNGPVRTLLLDDFYPAGDEYVLVHQATGRLIPPGGIPLQVGVVVHNSESLFNISEAVEGRPVIRKCVTVAGAVARPISTAVPIGIPLSELIRLAGGATTEDYVAWVGGLMMGRIESDLSKPVTKTTGGLILLPSGHRLAQRMTRPVKAMHHIGKSACDQCSYCTEFCPRYLLGYDVQPHKVMRTLAFSATGADNWSKWADLCCACGLCTLFSCPEDLFPKEACDQAKADRKTAGLDRWLGPARDVTPHAMEAGRHVPLKSLIRKLGVGTYDVPAPWVETDFQPASVTLPLSQHVGAPAVPLVKPGDKVRRGQLVAGIAEGKLGANIHASIEGTVRAVQGAIEITV